MRLEKLWEKLEGEIEESGKIEFDEGELFWDAMNGWDNLKLEIEFKSYPKHDKPGFYCDELYELANCMSGLDIDRFQFDFNCGPGFNAKFKIIECS